MFLWECNLFDMLFEKRAGNRKPISQYLYVYYHDVGIKKCMSNWYRITIFQEFFL